MNKFRLSRVAPCFLSIARDEKPHVENYTTKWTKMVEVRTLGRLSNSEGVQSSLKQPWKLLAKNQGTRTWTYGGGLMCRRSLAPWCSGPDQIANMAPQNDNDSGSGVSGGCNLRVDGASPVFFRLRPVFEHVLQNVKISS